MSDAVEICRGYTQEQWKQLRRQLDDSDDSAWERAVDVFERRIRERFLNCIEELIDGDSKADAEPSDCSTNRNNIGRIVVPGFAIMALCCLLAETLQSFREKQEIDNGKEFLSAASCKYPAGKCSRPATTGQFRKFLNRPAFNSEFSDEIVAKKFVNGIRNGILHEAETRKWRKQDRVLPGSQKRIQRISRRIA